MLLDLRQKCCLPKLSFSCTFSTYRFAKDYLQKAQPEKLDRKVVVQNSPISDVVSQPHITESYRRTSAKGLVPLEVEFESIIKSS